MGDDVRAPAEQFARRVLERCGDLLDERYPGRMYFVRRLPVRWDLDEASLTDDGLVDSSAEQLASAVVSGAESGAAGHRNGDYAVFDDEADWYASYLVARARRDADAWYFEALRSAHGGFVALLGRREAVSALDRLVEDGTLMAVLASFSGAELGALERVLGIPDSGRGFPLAGMADYRTPGEEADGRIHKQLVDRVSRAPAGLSTEAARIALFLEARRLLPDSAAPEEIVAIVSGVIDRIGTIGTRHADCSAAHDLPEPATPERGERSRVVPVAIETRYGRFFYLLSLILELGLGESLWKACLPEGLVLARVLAGLSPEVASDAAPGVLGGVPDATARFDVSPEQRENVGTELLARLAAMLPARGIAALPETNLFLERRGDAAWVVATPAGLRTSVFVCPLRQPSDLEAILTRFVRAWPPSAPAIFAPPWLAGVDRSGRVRPSRSAMPGPRFGELDAAAPDRTALTTQIAGSLLFLFGSRAGCEGSDWDDPVGWFRTPARIVSPSADLMEVRFAAAAIELEHRRSALDRDPGWIPWLGKTVKFHFAVSELGEG